MKALLCFVLACSAQETGNPWKELLQLAALEDEASQQKAAALFDELAPRLGGDEASVLERELLPLLQEGLQSPSGRMRRNAVSLAATLATLRPDSAALLGGFTPMFAKALNDEEEPIRVSAAVALASQQPEPGPGAIPLLIQLAEREMKQAAKDPLLLITAIGGLAECAACDNAESPILRSLDFVQAEEPRRRLIMAIGEGQSRHARILFRLAEIAGRETGKPRLAAVLALGNAGPAAAEAVPVLRALLEKVGDDGELEQAVNSSLKRITLVE